MGEGVGDRDFEALLPTAADLPRPAVLDEGGVPAEGAALQRLRLVSSRQR